MIKNFDCLRMDGEEVEKGSCQVVEEVPLSIFINGRHFTTAMISPEMRKEFVVGHLYSEGIISSVQEIESLEMEGDVARAIIDNPIRAIAPQRPIVSGCDGISSFLNEIRLPWIKSDLAIKKKQAQEAMKAISLSKIHVATGGAFRGLVWRVWPYALSRTSTAQCPDKAIGSLSLQDVEVDFSRIFAACTGRVSSDMARKCSVAGIPIVISRGATTDLAITIAQRTGLCIVGFLRGKKLTVYANPERFEVD